MSKSLWALVVVGVFFAAAPLQAQFALPTSDSVVIGILTLSDGSEARFSAREGTMVTVRNEDDGSWYGFIPVPHDHGKAFKVFSFELTPVEGALPDVQQLNKAGLPVQRGETDVAVPVLMKSRVDLPIRGQNISVRFGETQKWRFEKVLVIDPETAESSTLRTYGTSGGGLCSISCGSYTVTATAVKMKCGFCEGAR